MKKEALFITAATLAFTAAGSVFLHEANSIDAQEQRNQETPQIDRLANP